MVTDGTPMVIAAHLAVATERHGDEVVVRLLGELDASNADGLRDAIHGILESLPRTLVVDASGLGFADCAGLSVLVSTNRCLAGQGRKLVVANPQPRVRRLLIFTGLDALLRPGP